MESLSTVIPLVPKWRIIETFSVDLALYPSMATTLRGVAGNRYKKRQLANQWRKM
jgi:hypothetical protein